MTNFYNKLAVGEESRCGEESLSILGEFGSYLKGNTSLTKEEHVVGLRLLKAGHVLAEETFWGDASRYPSLTKACSAMLDFMTNTGEVQP